MERVLLFAQETTQKSVYLKIEELSLKLYNREKIDEKNYINYNTI